VGLYRKLLLFLGRARWATWAASTVFPPIDRFLYRISGGRMSLSHVGRRQALQTLLLTTTGRKSGQPRTTPVLYLEEGDALVVVASNYGKERHPAWSGNLMANPEASVQVNDSRRNVRARRADEAEKKRLWPRLLEIYPAWDDYTQRTERSFRAFFLEPR
jgi:deazaflavin-dependent oxidoreductase (nitroreductase family)